MVADLRNHIKTLATTTNLAQSSLARADDWKASEDALDSSAATKPAAAVPSLTTDVDRSLVAVFRDDITPVEASTTPHRLGPSTLTDVNRPRDRLSKEEQVAAIARLKAVLHVYKVAEERQPNLGHRETATLADDQTAGIQNVAQDNPFAVVMVEQEQAEHDLRAAPIVEIQEHAGQENDAQQGAGDVDDVVPGNNDVAPDDAIVALVNDSILLRFANEAERALRRLARVPNIVVFAHDDTLEFELDYNRCPTIARIAKEFLHNFFPSPAVLEAALPGLVAKDPKLRVFPEGHNLASMDDEELSRHRLKAIADLIQNATAHPELLHNCPDEPYNLLMLATDLQMLPVAHKLIALGADPHAAVMNPVSASSMHGPSGGFLQFGGGVVFSQCNG